MNKLNSVVDTSDDKILKILIEYNDYLFSFIDKDNIGIGTEKEDVIMWYNNKKSTVDNSPLDEIKLQPLFGSDYCKYSIIENQLKVLYENQEKLLMAIKFNTVKP